MSDEIYLVRSETLLGFDELVRELGGAPDPFYRQVALSASLLENPDYLVPYASVSALMDVAAKALGQENFGLMLGSRLKRFQIGVLWPLMAHCPNVEAAIEAVIEHYHLHNQGLAWTFGVEGDKAFIMREDRISGDIPTFQYAVHSLCSCFKVLQMLCGKDWLPLEVSFIHPAPVQLREYNRFFGVNVKFNQEFSQIVFPASDLYKEITDRNSSLYNQINKQVQEMEAQYDREHDLYTKVKRLIHQRIHSATCTQTAIAKQLSMHPKALQRELNRHGVTFRELRAEVRLVMAERYLKDSDIPLTTVAEILGFSELSSFSNAFKARHQVSPAVWRSRIKAEKA